MKAPIPKPTFVEYVRRRMTDRPTPTHPDPKDPGENPVGFVLPWWMRLRNPVDPSIRDKSKLKGIAK